MERIALKMKLTPVIAAAVMTASVLLTHYYGILPAIIFCAGLMMIFLLRLILFKRAELSFLVLMSAAVIASASYLLTTSAFMHPSLNYIGKNTSISGTVMSNPRPSGGNFQYTVRTGNIADGDISAGMRDTILLTTPAQLECGDAITFNGELKDFRHQMNENGFDAALWYRSQNLSSRIYSDEIVTRGKGFVFSPYFLSQKLYSYIDRIIYKFYYGDTAALISAILTGNMHNFSDEYSAELKSTAIRRQLHPAFIHIWIILTVIGLLRQLVHRRLRDAITIAILALYAVFSCTNIGFVRCIAIAAMLIFFKGRSGSASYRDMLAWVFIFCILTMPMILFNVTFIMSSVGGLVISQFYQPVYARLRRIPRPLRRFAAVALIIAFILTPISSVIFNGFCVYALFTPLITIPLVFVVLILSPAVFAMLAVFGAAPLFGGIFETALWVLLRLPGLVYRLPFSQIIIPTPTPAAFALIISLVFLAYYILKDRDIQYRIFGYISLGLLLSLCVSAVRHIGRTDMIFVNVGQGDGAVIHTAYGATVIIDGGGGNTQSDYDPGESIFVPYLASHGLSDIDAAFVSHFHKDHVQGVIAAINELNVRRVYYVQPQLRETEPLMWYAKLCEAAKARGTELCELSEDTRLSFERGLRLNIYLPDKLQLLSGDENNASLLIRAEYNGVSALYTGDMSALSEEEYIRRGAIVDSDILKVPHHGSRTAASAEWIAAVSPDFAVISCGENNPFGHPAKQTLETLDGVRVLRTDLDGDIHFTADGSGIIKARKFR